MTRATRATSPSRARDSRVLRFAVPVVVPSGLARSVRSARVVARHPRQISVDPSSGQAARADRRPADDRTRLSPRLGRATRRRRARRHRRRTHRATRSTDFGGIAVMTQRRSRDRHRPARRSRRRARQRDHRQRPGRRAADLPRRHRRGRRAAARPAGRSGIGTLRRQHHRSRRSRQPAVVKVVVDRRGYALYFSRAAIPFVRAGQPHADVLEAHRASTSTGASSCCSSRRCRRRRSSGPKDSNSCASWSTDSASAPSKPPSTPSASTRRRIWSACGDCVEAGRTPERHTWRRPTDSDP